MEFKPFREDEYLNKSQELIIGWYIQRDYDIVY